MNKIVVLDGFLVNPGDLSWEPLSKLANECIIHERTPPQLIIDRCQNANIIITNKVQLMQETLQSLPQLSYIGVTATGYNNIDVHFAKERNITVTNIPAYSTPSTAQHTIALLLEVSNQVGLHNQIVHQSEWVKSPDFSFWRKPLMELNNLSFGIVGFGTIGRKVASIASAFGMKILVYSRNKPKALDTENSTLDLNKIDFIDMDSLFKKSDIISLHCPLTSETKQIINQNSLNLMKPTAILLNTARGGLINEQALATALKENKIMAAAIDVLDKEPPEPECPLLNLPNCYITPHIAWASFASRKRLLAQVADNVAAYLRGTPINVV